MFCRRMSGILFVFAFCAGLADAITVRVTGDRVNLRAVDKPNAETVAQVSTGDQLEVLSGLDNEWVQVKPPQRVDLWIFAELVQGGQVAVSKAQVRAGAGLNFNVVGSLRRGDSVVERGRLGDWLKIAPPQGTSLWISRQYVEPVALQEKPAPQFAEREPTPIHPVLPLEPRAPEPVVAAVPSMPELKEVAPAPPEPAAWQGEPAAPGQAADAAPFPAAEETSESDATLLQVAPAATTTAVVPDASPPVVAEPPARGDIRTFETVQTGQYAEPKKEAFPPAVPGSSAGWESQQSPAASRAAPPLAPTTPARPRVLFPRQGSSQELVGPARIPADRLSPRMPQGRKGRYEGQLARAGAIFFTPSRHRLVVLNQAGRAVTACYVIGNEKQLEELLGGRLIVEGPVYWFRSSQYPSIIVESLQRRP